MVMVEGLDQFGRLRKKIGGMEKGYKKRTMEFLLLRAVGFV
jgi:hypothetical protein